MSGIPISALPGIVNPQLTDVIPTVQGGVTYKETIQQLVNIVSPNVTGFLPISGGTLTGPLILNADPTLPLGAASKQYVDTVAAGFKVILAALVATTANLNTTYSNGTAGVGATLTDASGTFAAFSVDGVSPALNSRVLVKNQTTTFQNGVYTLTTNGDGISVPYVLTRATDYDQAPTEIKPGTLIAVNSGTVNATSSWLETATVNTVGTDPILFSQFSFGPSSFLLKANNLSDVNSVSTARTNLGLGTAALKAASDNTKANLSSINGSTTIGHLAIFSDTNGTIQDGGAPATSVINFPNNGRLTLTSGTPVTTTDVVAATTIFFTPYLGNQISLFDGTSTWTTFTFSELSLSVPASTNQMYDVFAFNNSGSVAIESLAWTNDTTRSTALVLQNGVYVKSGSTTRRYIGSFRTTNVSGQCEDSLVKRYVWNYNNRILRPMQRVDPAASWTYSTAAWRQANGSTSNQIDFINGVPEDEVYVTVLGAVTSSVSVVNIGTSIGLDQSSTPNHTLLTSTSSSTSTNANSTAIYRNNNLLGRHFLTWMEFGGGSGTQTWYGTRNTATFITGGIYGWIKG